MFSDMLRDIPDDISAPADADFIFSPQPAAATRRPIRRFSRFLCQFERH
jgi:hypothetical protein